MFGFAERKRKPLDRKRSLDGIPVVNPGVHAEHDEHRIILKVRRLRGTGILARFQPPVLEQRVKLDELGSFVYGLIDGKRTAREIIGAFERRYQVNRREAELSCAEFLKALARRNAISIVIE